MSIFYIYDLCEECESLCFAWMDPSPGKDGFYQGYSDKEASYISLCPTCNEVYRENITKCLREIMFEDDTEWKQEFYCNLHEMEA